MTYNIEDKGRCGIYCIRNKFNNKVYIGKSINIYKRIVGHNSRLNKRDVKSENPHFINAWAKYGKNNFEYFVLEYLEVDEALVAERELHWINIFESNDRDKGYNIRIDSSTGMITSEETRAKMSKSHIERYKNVESRERLSASLKKMWNDNPDLKKQVAEKNKHHRSKYYIDQLDREGNLVKRWDFMKDLLEDNPEYKRHNIYAVCSGEKPSMYGYLWRKVMKEDIVHS